MKKPRRLWLDVLFKVPSGISRATVKTTLINSITHGDYTLPDGWKAVIKWRNKENAPMRSGEWSRVLTASAQSSKGFDSAVVNYLERM